MKKYPALCQTNQCTGCAACANACPNDAVTMTAGPDGFLLPNVDTRKCSGCGKCSNACPVLQPASATKTGDPAVYAIMTADPLRKASSSAGVFSLLSETVLAQGGLVCGAVFSADFRRVIHVLTDDPEKMKQMRKSKYLQSEIGTAYRQISQSLQCGRKVLFCGTPCQVAGLRSFLGREEAGLLTVDLVCNSAPSPLAWQAYLDEVSCGRIVGKADFRDKRYGWVSKVSLTFQDGTSFVEDESLSWMSPFLGGMISRESCRLCRYACPNRQGDITLGDFWGIENFDETLNDRMGTGMVLINTEKGRRIWDLLPENQAVTRVVPIPLTFAYKSSPRLLRGNREHPGRTVFFSALQTGSSFQHAREAASCVPYDWGILSWWNTTNYGAALTSYALYRTVEKTGARPILLDVSPALVRWNAAIECPDNADRRFICRYCETSNPLVSSEDWQDTNVWCAGYLVGSDQLWRLWRGQLAQEGAPYFLDFAREDKRKVAYATSFGVNQVTCAPDEQTVISYLLDRFDGISVRESDGVELCKQVFGISADVMLDPVFLCDAAEYRALGEDSKQAETHPDESYIAAYILQYTKEKERILQHISKQTGYPIVVLEDMNPNNRSDRWTLPLVEHASVEDWLYLLSHAALVLTDSYHGMCFSVIFEKDFLVLPPRSGAERFVSLANRLHLRSRLCFDLSDAAESNIWKEHISYFDIAAELQVQKDRSLQWLQAAMKSERTIPSVMPYDVYKIQTEWDFTRQREAFNVQLQQEREAREYVYNQLLAQSDALQQEREAREYVYNQLLAQSDALQQEREAREYVYNQLLAQLSQQRAEWELEVQRLSTPRWKRLLRSVKNPKS